MPASRQLGQSQPSDVHARPGEEGYILIAVLFLVALVFIGLAVAAPRMAKSIQRDKEIELVHRGEQYKRAIQLYYRKFGHYPTSIDQLLNTNNIRFLRKRYTDPITGKDDWRIIHLGQAKVPPLGFFGQPLAGIPGAANIGAPVSAATGLSSPTASSAFGSSTSPFGSSTSTFGTVTVNTPESPDSNSDSGDSGTTGQNAATNPSVTITGASPEPVAPSPTSPPAGTTGTSTSPFGNTGGTSGIGSGPTFGGGPIVGVGIPSTKASLLAYKKQTHYNKWEFVYNPMEDQMKAAGMLGAGSGSVNGSDKNSTSSPFGGSTGTSSPFGSGSSSPFGSSSSAFGPGSSNSGSSNNSGTNSSSGSSPQQ